VQLIGLSGHGTSDRVALATPHLDVKSGPSERGGWEVESRRMHFGSCLCGAVRFEVGGTFNDSIFVTADTVAKTRAQHTQPTCLRPGPP
jgi:hypothetical protein